MHLTDLKMVSLEGYSKYESKFEELWGLWVALLGEGIGAPDFLKKDRFLTGLCEPLREKVRGKFPTTYEEAATFAKRKKKKMVLYSKEGGSLSDHEGCPQHFPNEPWQPRPGPAPQGAVQLVERGQQDLLHHITQQLENLSVNLVGGRMQHKNQERGNRRQARELQCYNCGEAGHAMYFCPHPRRYGGGKNYQRGRH